MKIIHLITQAEIGGAQSVVINIANNLCQENDVTVVSGKSGLMWDLLDKKVTQIKIDSLVRKNSPLNDFLTLIKLIVIYHKINPDILHLHSSKIGTLGRLAFPAKKIVYTIHGFDSIRVAHRNYLPIEKILKNRAKSIIAVSKYDKENLIKEGINKNVSVIYNGINKKVIDTVIKSPFNNKKKIVLCIARIDPPKRFDLFIDIAKLLPEYNFLWVGNRIAPKSTPNNVICLGEIPLADRYYAISDLCILPSNYEGLPMAIIEAMSYGKPTVASNVGGISEIVLNDRNGFVLENIASQFAEKISYILENRDIHLRFSNCSKQIFEENLIVDKMVESYWKIYNN